MTYPIYRVEGVVLCARRDTDLFELSHYVICDSAEVCIEGVDQAEAMDQARTRRWSHYGLVAAPGLPALCPRDVRRSSSSMCAPGALQSAQDNVPSSEPQALVQAEAHSRLCMSVVRTEKRV